MLRFSAVHAMSGSNLHTNCCVFETSGIIAPERVWRGVRIRLETRAPAVNLAWRQVGTLVDIDGDQQETPYDPSLAFNAHGPQLLGSEAAHHNPDDRNLCCSLLKLEKLTADFSPSLPGFGADSKDVE